MKIVGFAGSTSSTSINRELVKYTLTMFANEEIHLLDLNDYSLPMFSVDEEKKGYPQEVYDFLKVIADADAVICSLAEHNRNFTTAFKNLFDWASRIELKAFQNKPMLLMATSPGSYGGGNVLELAQKHLPALGANIKGVFSLPKFGENFDLASGSISNSEWKEKHLEIIDLFKKEINSCS